MRIRLAIPDHLVTPEALEAALEATAIANEQAVARGEVPHAADAISRGVRWKPEPFSDGEHFDLADQVLGRGWGDCDDLAPWLAGSMRATGEDPHAIPRVYESAPGRWHVVVQTGDGEILDPSRWAGMGRKSSVSGHGCANGVCGVIAKPFARPGDGALAVLPRAGEYWARCDVPWPDTDTHLASHARARSPEAALDRAIAGAIECGNAVGADMERTVRAGTILLGDPEQAEIGFLPLAAAMAPQAQKTATSLLSKVFSKGHGLEKMLAKQWRGIARKKGWPLDANPYEHKKPGGGVSIPLEEAPPEGASQHMLLHYWPTGSPGPVIMRY